MTENNVSRVQTHEQTLELRSISMQHCVLTSGIEGASHCSYLVYNVLVVV
jgi:hypothetical protein